MPLHIIREDITRMQVDAIVAAGNANPCIPNPTGGVNGSIHRRAGERLLHALRRLGGAKTGGATITPGYDLPCKYVVHTAGPRWRGGTYGEETLLRACYTEALGLAKRKGLTSIAFPLISAGTYGYPRAEAMQVATSAIRAFLNEHDMMVYLVVYDRESFRISSELCEDVQQFIDQHYVDEHPAARNALPAQRCMAERDEVEFIDPPVMTDDEEAVRWQLQGSSKAESISDTDGMELFGPGSVPEMPWLEEATQRSLEPTPVEKATPEIQSATPYDDGDADWSGEIYGEASDGSALYPCAPSRPLASVRSGPRDGLMCRQERIPDSLQQQLQQLDEGFADMLLRLIDEKGMKDSVCYNRANVDRKLFSKIRSNPGYTPKKSTVAAFCIALELDMDMSRELLSRAGYAFSRSNMFDVIVEYFIGKRLYDVDIINQVLYAYDQPRLGSNVG